MLLIRDRLLRLLYVLCLFGVLFFAHSVKAYEPVCSAEWNVLSIIQGTSYYPFSTIYNQSDFYPCFVYLGKDGTYYYSRARVNPILITVNTKPPSLLLWCLILAHFFQIFWYYIRAFR